MYNKMNNLNNNIIKYNNNIENPILSKSLRINNEIPKIENLSEEKISNINKKYIEQIKKLTYDKNKLKEK